MRAAGEGRRERGPGRAGPGQARPGQARPAAPRQVPRPCGQEKPVKKRVKRGFFGAAAGLLVSKRPLDCPHRKALSRCVFVATAAVGCWGVNCVALQSQPNGCI